MEQTQRTTAAGKCADPYQVMYRMSELMAAMRTDLGLSNKSMGRHNRRLLRVLITDIDKQKLWVRVDGLANAQRRHAPNTRARV